jgi:zinc transporter ZupT
VVTTIRLCYEAAVAVALTLVVALLCGLIAAVVTGASSPNLPVATIAFLLTGGSMFFRIRRITQ